MGKILMAFALGIAVASGSAVSAQAPAPAPAAAVDTIPAAARAAAAAVDSFHAALRRGDTQAALAMLSEDAIIFEEGGAERSRAEYAAHHLGADAAFAKAVPSTRTRRTGFAAGSLAWIASEARTQGSFNGRAVDRTNAETMVLRKVGRGWKIVHIHWSSAAGAR